MRKGWLKKVLSASAKDSFRLFGARRGNPDRSIGLHAWKIAWLHQSQKNKMTFQANVPQDGLWSKFATLQESIKPTFKDYNESGDA